VQTVCHPGFIDAAQPARQRAGGHYEITADCSSTTESSPRSTTRSSLIPPMLGVGLTDEEGGDGQHGMPSAAAGGLLRCCGERTEGGEGPFGLLVVAFGGVSVVEWVSRLGPPCRSGRGPG
jgi:hypothetical protein